MAPGPSRRRLGPVRRRVSVRCIGMGTRYRGTPLAKRRGVRPRTRYPVPAPEALARLLVRTTRTPRSSRTRRWPSGSSTCLRLGGRPRAAAPPPAAPRPSRARGDRAARAAIIGGGASATAGAAGTAPAVVSRRLGPKQTIRLHQRLISSPKPSTRSSPRALPPARSMASCSPITTSTAPPPRGAGGARRRARPPHRAPPAPARVVVALADVVVEVAGRRGSRSRGCPRRGGRQGPRGRGAPCRGRPACPPRLHHHAHRVGVVRVVEDDLERVLVEDVEAAGRFVVARRERAQAVADVVDGDAVHRVLAEREGQAGRRTTVAERDVRRRPGLRARRERDGPHHHRPHPPRLAHVLDELLRSARPPQRSSDEHPFKVILDYAAQPRRGEHDGGPRGQAGRPPASAASSSAAPGDRRDEDIREIATLAAGHFDHYVCKRDDNPRGRGETEVPDMLRDALRRRWRGARGRRRGDRRAGGHRPRTGVGGGERPRAHLRRRDQPLVEADHLLRPSLWRRRARPRRAAHRGGAAADDGGASGLGRLWRRDGLGAAGQGPPSRGRPPSRRRWNSPTASASSATIAACAWSTTRRRTSASGAGTGYRVRGTERSDASPEGCLCTSYPVPMHLTDTRRLTGPSLLLDGPGAIAEVSVDDDHAEPLGGGVAPEAPGALPRGRVGRARDGRAALPRRRVAGVCGAAGRARPPPRRSTRPPSRRPSKTSAAIPRLRSTASAKRTRQRRCGRAWADERNPALLALEAALAPEARRFSGTTTRPRSGSGPGARLGMRAGSPRQRRSTGTRSTGFRRHSSRARMGSRPPRGCSRPSCAPLAPCRG